MRDVTQTHDTRMEYVRKIGRHGILTTICVNEAEKFNQITSNTSETPYETCKTISHCQARESTWDAGFTGRPPLVPALFFPSHFLIILPCQVKPTRKINKNSLFRTHRCRILTSTTLI